jgi:hypothetical protein
MPRQEHRGKNYAGNVPGTPRRRLFLSLLVLTALSAGILYHSVQQAKKSHALIAAVERDDLKDVKRLLRQGADPNTHLVYENTPRTPLQLLQWLVRSRDIVWHNAPVLVEASAEGHTPIVEALLAGGADIDETDQDRWTALMTAAGGGRAEVVRLLLNRGADINAQGIAGRTALSLATENDHPDVVRMLQRAKVGE